MKLIGPEKEQVREVTIHQLVNGDVCWTPELGVCMKTALGFINLHDGKERKVIPNLLVVPCVASCYWSKELVNE